MYVSPRSTTVIVGSLADISNNPNARSQAMAWIYRQVSASSAPTKHLIIRSEDTYESKQTNHYSHAAFPNISSDDPIILLREHDESGVSSFAALLDIVMAKTWNDQENSARTSVISWGSSAMVSGCMVSAFSCVGSECYMIIHVNQSDATLPKTYFVPF